MLYKVSSYEWIDVKKSNKLVSICLILAAKVIFFNELINQSSIRLILLIFPVSDHLP